MKTTTLNALLGGLLLLFSKPALAGANEGDLCREADKTILLFKDFDPAMTNFFERAAGYVVFPGVGRGGFYLGIEHGKGVVYEKGTGIGTVTMTAVTVGAQVGAQALSEIIFFETPEVLERFKKNTCELSAELSAVALKEGAALKANYELGVVVFTHPKAGLMVQAAVGGQKFKFTPNDQRLSNLQLPAGKKD